MLIELVVVPEYPQEAPAATLLRSALDDVGLYKVRLFGSGWSAVPQQRRRSVSLVRRRSWCRGETCSMSRAGRRPWRAGSISAARCCPVWTSCVAA